MTAAAPQHKIVHRAYEPRHDHNLELNFPDFSFTRSWIFRSIQFIGKKNGKGFKPGERESERKREGERQRQTEREIKKLSNRDCAESLVAETML